MTKLKIQIFILNIYNFICDVGLGSSFVAGDCLPITGRSDNAFLQKYNFPLSRLTIFQQPNVSTQP